MPELPDIRLYLEALAPRLRGTTLQQVRVLRPFLLRTVDPPLQAAAGRRVTGLSRIGKRIVISLEGDLYFVIHLMIAGRFRWRPRDAAPPARVGLAAFDFDSGTLVLTEAGTKRRASLHLIRGEEALRGFDRGGLDVDTATSDRFRQALRRENHTLKRALTDPAILDGIGSAYSDEILHRARLSPLTWTSRLSDAELDRLHQASRAVLQEWTDRLREEGKGRFPEKVTAFRPGMAVHGRYGQPCPVCSTAIQRVRYADHETNYCPTCQTGGKLLADRALSRLLREDWPRTLEELEERRARASAD